MSYLPQGNQLHTCICSLLQVLVEMTKKGLQKDDQMVLNKTEPDYYEFCYSIYTIFGSMVVALLIRNSFSLEEIAFLMMLLLFTCEYCDRQ